MHRRRLTLETPGRCTLDITPQVQAAVAESGVREGVANVFVHHTSCSLMINENADPAVQRDLEAFFARLVPDGDRRFEHTAEGPDDMPAHVRSVLTATSLTIPVEGGRCSLGTWQGIYLFEHRHRPHTRRVTVTTWG